MTTAIYTKIKSVTRTAMAMETFTKIECMEVMPLFLSTTQYHYKCVRSKLKYDYVCVR